MRKKSAGPKGNVQGNDQENQRVQFILRIAIAAALGGFLFDCGAMELSFCHAHRFQQIKYGNRLLNWAISLR